jgi:hypothetical protein
VQLKKYISRKLRRAVVSILLLAQFTLLLAAAVHQHADIRVAEPGVLRVCPANSHLTSASDIERLCVTCRVIRQCLAQISAGNRVPHVLTHRRLRVIVATCQLHPVPRFFVCPRAPPSFS